MKGGGREEGRKRACHSEGDGQRAQQRILEPLHACRPVQIPKKLRAKEE